MKKFLSLMAVCAIIFSANCSRVEQNNDPIVGIWFQSEAEIISVSSKSTLRKEWIFNDVYLGRYHEINGNNITLQTDFKWSKEDDVYTIEYRGLENVPTDRFKIVKTAEGTILEKIDGDYLAIRE
ncbi:hypothetical protein PP182_00250 [Maribacter sp. PR1]|uniref:Lipocalin-like domain-containing protein n=1 Tax=Maribacter cobaltidurans TaxID=1178778 RepID=A0ABU7INE0_9FLAO|nr:MULTISPECIES: hypothetical protein [Maribacter]MDC6387093.1 hypothetical protein [Maribacter sp. PR1]MEE1974479.1 hypothetical protein [Maribacter cobaltidurans]